MSRNLTALLALLVICLGVEFVSGFATRQSVSTWYVTLNKPSWTPPGWIFPPVWTLLYVSMAVAAWLVWQRRGAHLIGVSAVLFGSQLALNALWSFVFFNGRNIGLAFVDIALLWVALGATVWWFWSVRPAAGALLVPYFLWVSFAMALNYSILKLNA